MLTRKVLPLIIMCLISAIAVDAQEQERTITGRVLIKECNNKPVAGDQVDIKVLHDGHAVPHKPLHSKGGSWMHKMPVGASNVEVTFWLARYQQASLFITEVTTKETQEVTTVTLDPNWSYIPPCRGRKGGKNVFVSSVAAPDSIMKVNVEQNQVDNKDIERDSSDLAKPSSEELLRDLKEDAELALKFGALDIFQYNFEETAVAFSQDKELSAALEQFRNDGQNSAFFQSQGNRSPELFRSIIEKQFAKKGTLDRGQINALIRDSSISPSIRGSAVVALLETDLSEGEKEEERKIFREYAGDENSDLYLTSVIALARIGTPADREMISAGINTQNNERVVAALKAIWVVRSMEDKTAFATSVDAIAGLAVKNSDPDVRLAATQSLTTYIPWRYPAAISALSQQLKQDESEDVRVEAATALSFGTLERRPDVHAVLVNASRRDSSLEVREAATVALSGRN